jgi:multidrug efflux pump subunit AcrB
MAMYLLKPHHAGHAQFALEVHGDGTHGPAHRPRNPLARFQHGFERRFAQLREGYRGILSLALQHRGRFVGGFLICVLASFLLLPFLGADFFPTVDAGEMTLHVRAPVGTRIEETAALFDHVEQAVRQTIPPRDLVSIVDNIGLPISGINRAYLNTGGIGPMDGDIYITLAESHRPTAMYAKQLRALLPREFPGSTFSFLPADMVGQILNFGAPAPIDVQVAGPDRTADEAYAEELTRDLTHIPGLADVRLEQSAHYPEYRIALDRTRADRLGITENDVTKALVTTLAGSFQTAPAQWLDVRQGNSYPIVMQSPQQDVDTLSKLGNIPLTGAAPGGMQVLGGLATITRDDSDAVVSHYNIQPSFDVYAAPQDRDLGSLSAAVSQVLKATANDLPKGAAVTVRGQVATMNTAFAGLGFGLAGAIVLIYLMIVVNFQSWIDPFVIITALPAALAGIVWILFATGTSLSVPALTGAIMCMGVATANSILVVSFARERLAVTGDPVVAALEAGFTRFRPVLMTALAMIIGMAPMALGLGEGGEQNAPLGRAVVGGLIFATAATLIFVPVIFSIAHARKAHDPIPDAAAQPAHA